jgi:hypothetical protein
MKRTFILSAISFILIGVFAVPAFAQIQTTSQSKQIWAVGVGYVTLPSADDKDGTIDTAGEYASVQMISSNYLMEGDYGFNGPKFIAVAADYLYPVSSGEAGGMNGAFVGAGYTYFSSDDLGKNQGLNVIAGIQVGENLVGTLRYDFPGSDSSMITVGFSYAFK